MLQSKRDYSFCGFSGKTQDDIDADPSSRFTCGGSATSATGTFLQYDPVFDTLTQTFVPGAFTDLFQVQGNEFVNYYTAFNFNPYNYFQRPDERYTFGAFADYEISPAFKPYAEMMFMDDTSDAVIAPSGDFFETNSIACDNALLTQEQADRLCITGPFGDKTTFVTPLNGMADVEQAFVYVGRRNVEGGGRTDLINHNAFRIVGGMRGDAARGISYDSYFQFGQTTRNYRNANQFSVTRLERALDAVAVLDGQIVPRGTPGATIVCRAAFTGIDPNCVPYNIFQAGGVTQGALDYLSTPGFQRGLIQETVAHVDATISGDEYGWRVPWAEDGVGVNVGAEYRRERLDFRVDDVFSSGDIAGSGGPTLPVEGQFDVRELFAEVQLPIVQHNFIEDFTVSAGYRFSNYHVADNSFNTDTYKIQAELAPIPDIRLRGSYNRAVRAPNIVELFTPTQLGLSGIVDPCAGAVGANGIVAGGATFAQCQLTGVTAAQYGNIAPNPANQYNGLFSGNPNLLPEKADTYTLGVILQPRFVPGLAVTVDYWKIKIKNLISAPSFAGVFQSCFNGDAASCALVNRAPGTGSLWLGELGFVELPIQNFEGTGLSTSGIDFQASYSRRLGGLGTFNAAFVGTYLKTLGTPFDDEPGVFAGTTPSPIWRHTMRVGLTMPSGLGVSVRWRHFSGVDCRTEIDPQTGNPFDPGCGRADDPGSILPGNLRLSAQDYFDLSLNARIGDRLNLRMGANNIFDRDPPIAGDDVIPPVFGNGNTYPQVYDALGRYLFAGFTVDF